MIYRVRVKCFLSTMMAVVFSMPSICSDIDKDHNSKNPIIGAYELRIDGKADKAEELLTGLMKQDSTNALACFELARTKQHLFLGKEQLSPEEWGNIVNTFRQAMRLAPSNKIFAFYFAYSCFTDAFMSMMMQKQDVSGKIKQACSAFEHVLSLDPGCHDASLYLVDIYAYLPGEMGGDREKAFRLASDLYKRDKIWGAMANARLMPDSSDFISFWQNVKKEQENNTQVSEELGRVYLLNSDTDNGTKYFLEAVNADKTKRYLYMNLIRYHMISSQQNPEARKKHLEEAERLANIFLQSDPNLIAPVKAHVYGIMGLIRMIGGDNTGSDKYRQMAASTDPYYSRATGRPPEMLYERPDEVKIHYYSFFMPF